MNFIRKILNRLRCYKANLIFAKRLVCIPWKKKIILVGTPEYNNAGDSILVTAALKLYSDMLKKFKAVEITKSEYYRYKNTIKLCLSKRDIITFQPGGNMGNVWIDEENCRRDVIQSFPDNKIISMPQTIYYEEDSKGQKSLEDSKVIYGEHTNLIIAAREKVSYNLMKAYYPNNKVILIPDMALYLDAYRSDKKREGILLCLRHDGEKLITEEDEIKIKNALYNKPYSYMDMYSKENPDRFNRRSIVKEKLDEFTKAELVITDRLHGMICCALTETPCVIMSNNNHKVKGVYEWIKDLEYIEFIDNVEELSAAIENVMAVKDRHYSNERFKPYFEQIVKAIDEV